MLAVKNQWLADKYKDKGEYDDRRRNVNELVNSIGEFSRTNPGSNLGDYLQSISLYTAGGESTLEAVHARGVRPLSSLIRRSTLEDVFLRLTGRSLTE